MAQKQLDHVFLKIKISKKRLSKIKSSWAKKKKSKLRFAKTRLLPILPSLVDKGINLGVLAGCKPLRLL